VIAGEVWILRFLPATCPGFEGRQVAQDDKVNAILLFFGYIILKGEQISFMRQKLIYLIVYIMTSFACTLTSTPIPPTPVETTAPTNTAFAPVTDTSVPSAAQLRLSQPKH
jgi:hypothetical protein